MLGGQSSVGIRFVPGHLGREIKGLMKINSVPKCPPLVEGVINTMTTVLPGRRARHLQE